MNKFKGTQGKWFKSQISNGDIEIHAKGFRNLATVNFYPDGFREQYINGKPSGSPAPDSLQFRRECIYNAKVIVKAPEMLEMLSTILAMHNHGDILSQNELDKIEILIKEATYP